MPSTAAVGVFSAATAYRAKRVNKPDGTYTSYTYSDWDGGGYPVTPPGNWTYPYVSTTTSYLGKISKTIIDGFGRPVFQMARESASPEVWITTKTEYSACSCSSTGKSYRTSRPYKTDANGNALSGQGNPPPPFWTTSSFDALGRPTQVVLPDGYKTTYAYAVENGGTWKGTLTTVTPPKLITDPTGKPKRYLNDAFGRLIRVEEPKANLELAKTAEYTFDVLGRMTDAWTFRRDGTASQNRHFVYNSLGQLTSATNPENGTVSYTYFSDGLLESKRDQKNQILWFFYDANHRLLRIESPQGTVKTSFTYDSATNGVGKMATGSNDGHTWRYSYDIMGRVTTQTLQTPIVNPNNPNQYFTATAQYGFDYDGQLTNLYYPGTGYAASGGSVAVGTQHQYAYDAVGRPTSLQYYSGGWITAAQNAQYNAAGQITSWQDGVATLTRSYDAMRGWITNISATQGLSLVNVTYSYQPDGRVASVTDGVYSAQSATYGYDELNRLTSATAGNWAMTWTYDDFGNRTSQTLGGQTTTLAYANNDNRITSNGYGYDANGNTTSMPGFTNMQYDVFDRLTSATASSSYNYDAFGRRVWRWTPDASQHVYFYDMSGRLLSEFVVGGATTSYQYFAGQRVGHYTDRIGNVRYANGIARHYYPYGEEITSTNSDTYKFAELHRDSDTGLDYAMARYYASGVGRFLTPDRIAGDTLSPQSLNLYAYVTNEPANLNDPEGLCPPGYVEANAFQRLIIVAAANAYVGQGIGYSSGVHFQTNSNGGLAAIDCSGLVSQAIAGIGLPFDSSTFTQANFTFSTGQASSLFSVDSTYRVGDIIYFPPTSSDPYAHVGIVTGVDSSGHPTSFIGSQSSTGPDTVDLTDVQHPYWSNRLSSATAYQPCVPADMPTQSIGGGAVTPGQGGGGGPWWKRFLDWFTGWLGSIPTPRPPILM